MEHVWNDKVILTQILSYFYYDDLKQLKLVNKRFNQVVEHLLNTTGLFLIMKYKVIDNDHNGYCSGDSCEEIDYDEYIKFYKPITFDDHLDSLTVGYRLEYPEINKYNRDPDAIGGDSGYCANRSDVFDIHTRNYIVMSVKVANLPMIRRVYETPKPKWYRSSLYYSYSTLRHEDFQIWGIPSIV